MWYHQHARAGYAEGLGWNSGHSGFYSEESPQKRGKRKCGLGRGLGREDQLGLSVLLGLEVRIYSSHEIWFKVRLGLGLGCSDSQG